MIYIKLPLFLITLFLHQVNKKKNEERTKKKCVDIFIPTLIFFQCPVSEDLRINITKEITIRKIQKFPFKINLNKKAPKIKLFPFIFYLALIFP